jgi:hypothetical protein
MAPGQTGVHVNKQTKGDKADGYQPINDKHLNPHLRYNALFYAPQAAVVHDAAKWKTPPRDIGLQSKAGRTCRSAGLNEKLTCP